LRILRSDANRRAMVWGGNLFTYYEYRLAKAEVRATPEMLKIEITTPDAEADVQVSAQLNTAPDAPPGGSPFCDLHQARLFAGPMPFTFDYERQTHSIIVIEGVRENWKPIPVDVKVKRLTFLDRPPFNQTSPVLANAFYVRDIPYAWKRGVCYPLTPDQ